MYRLMISFKRDEPDRFGIGSRPYDFFVKSAEDVCEIISSISHLKPIITLCQEEILTTDEVLKCFELKDTGF